MSLCCHDENRDQFFFLDKGSLDLNKRLLKTNSNESEGQPECKITSLPEVGKLEGVSFLQNISTFLFLKLNVADVPLTENLSLDFLGMQLWPCLTNAVTC